MNDKIEVCTADERERYLRDVRAAHRRCFDILAEVGVSGAMIVSVVKTEVRRRPAVTTQVAKLDEDDDEFSGGDIVRCVVDSLREVGALDD